MKTITLRMLADVYTSALGPLKAGSIHSFELLESGTNWRRVRLSKGRTKTLFNFEASLVQHFSEQIPVKGGAR